LKNSKLDTVPSDAAREQTDARSIAVAAHRIDSRDLFVGTREITIGHGGETYRLRLTAQNKLILTK
jgi:hemin uptake protein HemP